MAKLEIFNSKANIKDSNTPRTSALALPFSLATQRGAAITDVAKSIASIQKDMYAIEDTNNYNKALPALSLEIDKKYSKYKESRDTNAPNKLIKDLEPSNFKSFLNGQSVPVQRLLKSKLAEKASLLVPKLNSQIVENNIEDFTLSLGTAFDTAISQMISKDQGEMAIGTIAFGKLINNKAAAGYIGQKEFETLVEAKTKIKNNLLLNVNLQINPKEIIENQEALIEAVGPDAAKEYLFKAKTALVSKRVDKENKERLQDLQDQETQIGAFTEVLLRIDNFQKNKTDTNSKNEMPTINEVYQMYENGIINEAMFVKISDFITEDAQDGMTDNELFMAITTQIHSATTIQQLDDIKKSYITDNNFLKNMAMTDINQFNALIDKSKSDFESHRDYKFYSKLINANIRNISTVKGAKGQALSAAIANKEQFILQSYNAKVLDGMSPENAYLSVLEEDFNEDHIPTLNTLPFPVKGVKWDTALADTSYFDNVAKQVLERFENSNKSSFDAKKLIDDLDQINFVRDVLTIRMSVAPGADNTEKFTWATKDGAHTSKFKIKDVD
ncbi:hypothetical protein ACIJYB_03955 [Candidatus Pelagibacter bacterium nBUS_44]|uniref:hypothetical protein n=1 Tax=Candidatus Pelagibacter bacterium nBUS_44 TaxID=3374195 RepID=UPI003EBF1FCC